MGDTNGRIIDAAYYNNMKACGGKAVVHSGDDPAGGPGCEDVRVVLKLVPVNVHMILFLVCSYKGGALQDAPSLRVAFEEKPEKRIILQPSVDTRSSGSLAAALVRQKGSLGWQLREVGEQLTEARHFMDCLDVLNRYIVTEIPTANKRQKVAFAMEKGNVLDLRATEEKVTVGLGWDIDKGKVDMDASAVILDSKGEVLESIFFGNRKSSLRHSQRGAIEHSGDNQTGEGEGDDEAMVVRLGLLGDTVCHIFFCIHIYSKDRDGQPKTFTSVANPYCRVVEETAGEEICRYTLDDAGDRSGLLIARLRRESDGRWGFQALGIPSQGTMYKDSIPDMQRIALDPRELSTPPGNSQQGNALVAIEVGERSSPATCGPGPGACMLQ